jgi:hypothetical protein
MIWKDIFNYLEFKNLFFHIPLLKACLEINLQQSLTIINSIENLYEKKSFMCPMLSEEKIKKAVLKI